MMIFDELIIELIDDLTPVSQQLGHSPPSTFRVVYISVLYILMIKGRVGHYDQ
jgi:hypothetical protein